MRCSIPNRHSTGFSLLEVLIAVVVLATGFLALTALQISLTRSSADAKVRGRLAAMLTTRMDDLRNAGYGTLADGGPTTFTSTTGGWARWPPARRLRPGRAPPALRPARPRRRRFRNSNGCC